MDSDSDKEKYYASEDAEDEQEPRPPTRRSSVSPTASPDFSASSSEDEDDVGNVAGQQPQPCLWTLPPKTRRCVVHTFTGAPDGKSSEAAHVTREFTPLSVLLLFFAEIITLLVVDMNCYRSGNVCVFGSDITVGTYSSRQAGGLLDENGIALLSILRTDGNTC
jgi:hypothetical protein